MNIEFKPNISSFNTKLYFKKSYTKQNNNIKPNQTNCLDYSNVVNTPRLTLNPKLTNFDGLDKTLYSKIQSQMNCYNTNDINNIIEQITKQGINNEDALCALNILTQFGNLDSMKIMSKEFKKLNISKFTNTGNFSMNSAFQYFFYEKYSLLSSLGKEGYILNNNSLKYLKDNPDELKKLKNDSKVEFITIEGLDDGINIFNQGIDIEKFSSNTINLIKKAKQLQKKQKITFENAFKLILNKNIDEKAKALKIDYKTISNPNLNENPDVNSIASNLAPKNIGFQHLKNILCAIVEETKTPDKITLFKLLTKYFISEVDIYTPKCLGERMKEIHQAVLHQTSLLKKSDNSEFNEDDITYIIPFKNKSYDEIALQYALVNNIDFNKFEYLNDYDLYSKDNKIHVVLDDILASGMSIMDEGLRYSFFNKELKDDNHIFVAPVLANEEGYFRTTNLFKSAKRADKDFLIYNHPIKKYFYDAPFYNSLNEKERQLFSKCFNIKQNGVLGISCAGLCVAFPYMTPDNNFNISTQLLQNFTLNKLPVKNLYNNLEVTKRISNYDSIYGLD